MERLQKYISECGIASRRKAEELILKGKVKVNGKVVNTLGTKVSANDMVMVNNKVISSEIKEYYLLNKPREVISASSDNKGRRTVVDLINTEKRIYPIGRLDYDTTGLILLTNDGELSNLLTHPSKNIEKEYLAKIDGFLTKEEAATLSKGIILNGVKTKEAYFKMKEYDKKTNTSYVKVIITEGRNHQVKEMFKYVNKNVLKLTRVRYAFLTLDNLKSGEYRRLSTKEVHMLYSLK